MSSSLRPLTTGQLLNLTFQTYRQNFILFAGISAVPRACLLVMQLCILAVVGLPGKAPGRAVAVVLVVALLASLVSVVAGAIATAATAFGVSDIYLDKETSVSGCFARVRGKIGKVILTSIEFGLFVGLSLILFIFPGIYFAGKLGLAVPAVVLEDVKVQQAFERSSKLTEGAIGRIFAIYFLTWILIVAISAGVAAGLAVLAPSLTKAAGTVTSAVFQYLVSALVNTLITPVMAIALTLAYYDQRVRKEAFDIERMMSLLGEPTAARAKNKMGARS